MSENSVSGTMSLSAEKLRVNTRKFESINLQGEFGFVPSKKYMYIAGVPIDPLVSPTFLKINTCQFIQPSVNSEPVDLKLNYVTDSDIHLKEFSYKVGNASCTLELLSEKPNNLGLFAFEKQTFWFGCTYNEFSLGDFLNRVGVVSEKIQVITGFFISSVLYRPTELFSWAKLSDVQFNKLSVGLTINEKVLSASGDASYKDGNLDLKGVKVIDDQLGLLEAFLMTYL